MSGTKILMRQTRVNRVLLTSNTTLDVSHHYVACDASAGAFNVTLPDATTCSGTVYKVKKIDSGANAVTVTTTASQTIEGAANWPINFQWEGYAFVSNGSNWERLP